MRRVLSISLLTLVSAAACEADLDSECIGGDCEPYVPTVPEPGAGGAAACYEGCTTDVVSNNVGELPCSVDAVLGNCRRCHTRPLQGGAPFPLDTYEDTQQLYQGATIWSRLNGVLSIDFMPAQPPLLTDEQKAVILDDWACQCAPPRPEDEACP